MKKKYLSERLRRIYDKTDGNCHLCRGSLAFSNYGNLGSRGAWEVDHSIPKAKDGTDNLNNLFPAHTSCNRSKQDKHKNAIRRHFNYFGREEPTSLGELIGSALLLMGTIKLINNLSQSKGGDYYGQKRANL